MGNREDLIAGAQRCIEEKGFARVTARDIASAAGTSLAAIGYHFGSKEALMSAALIETSGPALGEELATAIDRSARRRTRLARFAATWAHLLSAFDAHRSIIVASVENAAQANHLPEVRDSLVAARATAIDRIAGMLQAADGTLDNEAAHALAVLHYTLLNGLMLQWIVEPSATPSSDELTEAVLTLAAPNRRGPGGRR